MSLFDLHVRRARVPASIDLRCCSVDDIMDARGVRLVHADPPWQYQNAPGVANPEDAGLYSGLPNETIARHLDRSFDCVDEGRLAVWYTWPKDAEWTAAGGAGRWGPRKSGGAWLKTPHVGVGYHWRGWTEPVALFAKGATGRPAEMLGNGWASRPTDHSEKPIEWLRAWVRAWTSPSDLVLDMYAGLGSMAVACTLEGRRYLGAELDPERHAAALARVEKVTCW